MPEKHGSVFGAWVKVPQPRARREGYDPRCQTVPKRPLSGCPHVRPDRTFVAELTCHSRRLSLRCVELPDSAFLQTPAFQSRERAVPDQDSHLVGSVRVFDPRQIRGVHAVVVIPVSVTGETRTRQPAGGHASARQLISKSCRGQLPPVKAEGHQRASGSDRQPRGSPSSPAGTVPAARPLVTASLHLQVSNEDFLNH